MKSGFRHPAFRLALLCILGGVLGAQEPGGAPAHVIELKGTLTVKRLRQEPVFLKLHGAVQVGDELATGPDSEALIRTRSGASVRIYPDSRIVFNEQSADIREILHLFLGSIKVWIERVSGRPNPHKLTTPTAVIAVRGTTFSVFVDEDDATLVAVDEGTVGVANLRSPEDEVILNAGQRTWVRRGQRPAQAQQFRGRSERADLIPARSSSASDTTSGAMAGKGMTSRGHEGTMLRTGSSQMGMTGHRMWPD